MRKRKGDVILKIETAQSTSSENSTKRKVNVFLTPSFKPLLGFIRMRLIYDKDQFSKKYSLLSPSSGKIFDKKLDGLFYWDLPEIREYSVENSILYFEDLFQFFSFAVQIESSSRFYSPPAAIPSEEISSNPRKTEETTIRIDELKRVEGELLHYKDFESNDDVRRIVWKIYAKNKELVVRVPEILDPYASHIYMYASFFNSISFPETEVLSVAFLNYYKTAAWTIYQELAKKGLEVRFISDQSFSTNNASDQKEFIRYSLTLSKWQTNTSLRSFVNKRSAGAVVISSLNSVVEVEEMMSEYGNEITFVLVKLSESMREDKIQDWIKWFFIKEDEKDSLLLNSAWKISPLRLRILQNEKELERLIKGQDRSKVFKVRSEVK